MNLSIFKEQYSKIKYDKKASRKLIKEFESIAFNNNDDIMIGIFYYVKAEQDYINGRLDKCKQHIYEALKYLKELRISETISCYNLLGLIYDNLNDSISSLEMYLKSLNIKLLEPNYRMTSVIYNNIGNLFLNNDDAKTAIKYYKLGIKNLRINKCKEYGDLAIALHMNLGISYIKIKDSKNARKQSNYLVDNFNNALGHRISLTNSYLNLCIACIEKKLVDINLHAIEYLKLMKQELYLDYIPEILSSIPLWLDNNLIDFCDEVLTLCYYVITKDSNRAYLSQYYLQCVNYYLKHNDLKKAYETSFLYLKTNEKGNRTIRKNLTIGLNDRLSLFELNNELSQIYDLSITDQLTGLYNRRVLDGDVKIKFLKAIKNETKVGVIIVDIDYFKQFNDTHGHLKGDECLKKIANILSVNCSKYSNSTLLRYGGDEFIMFFFDTNLDDMLICAEKNKQDVLNLDLKIQDIKVTLTQGVYYNLPYHDSRVYDYILSADRLLYKGKLSKNAIVTEFDAS